MNAPKKNARAGRAEQAESRKTLARLMHVWEQGARCVAAMDILYADSGLTIAEGTLGTVRFITRARVVVVQWDADGDGRVAVLHTSPDSIDPAPPETGGAS